MLPGEKVVLVAPRPADAAELHAELYEDVLIRSSADNRPWVPIGPERSPLAIDPPHDDTALFSVRDRADDALAGQALLWAINTHSRSAHIGIALRPACRGRGFAADVLDILARYAFRIRGLNRVSLETLGSNAPMIAAARRAGFRHEGTLREGAWVDGAFRDEVVYGLLASEWPSPA
ncbi:MAG TPA: GNAT family protein [Jatrophihabitans sp.]|uniref:GNAT family N-acetyltransferase n=1 Tax=Jatrophihabitans sp. TaxID=1932789 RepID=UPI002DFC4835|nr:GNAT family protein [Jatrophihabitans sp.]